MYRPRALELLGSFLALGPWAVNLVLNVGIFPYILRLLQSQARELRPLLIYLWAKILAVDPVRTLYIIVILSMNTAIIININFYLKSYD